MRIDFKYIFCLGGLIFWGQGLFLKSIYTNGPKNTPKNQGLIRESPMEFLAHGRSQWLRFQGPDRYRFDCCTGLNCRKEGSFFGKDVLLLTCSQVEGAKHVKTKHARFGRMFFQHPVIVLYFEWFCIYPYAIPSMRLSYLPTVAININQM